MSQKTDTHYYDGKLQIAKVYLTKDISKASKEDDDLKVTVFQLLKDHITSLKSPLKTPNALRCLSSIIDSFLTYKRTVRSPNYDSKNDLYACDLLYLCCNHICIMEDDDFTESFLRQLDDMASGLCPQGRTTRLLQILYAQD